MLKKLEQTVEWLFERAPEGWYGQLAFGRADKTATLWLPGNRRAETAQRLIRTAAIGGATQRAYLHPTEPQRDQSCWICWVGLDIDDVDTAAKRALVHSVIPYGWSLRASHSGNGLHAMLRLARPVFCHHTQSNSVVKKITAGAVDTLKTAGVEVCKADCRVFWLEGGRQEWIEQCEAFVDPTVVVPTPIEQTRAVPTVDLSGLKPGIAAWAERFIRAGVIRSIKPGQPCYLREAIEVITSSGETVQTRSSLRPKSGGFIDLAADRIQLWAHADGGVIWSYEEPELE